MSSFSDEPGRPEVPDAAPSSAETRAGRRAAREAAAGAPAWSAASQAVVVGGLSLIPARKYPGWLKQGLTWGSTGLVAAVALTPGATSGLLKALSAKYGDAERAAQQEEPGQAGQREQAVPGQAAGESASSDSSSEAREDAGRSQVSWMTRSAAALVAGGFTYGAWRFTWWADEAAERALRRLCVPAPRVVMAVGAGVLTYREVRRDQQARDQRAQDQQPQRQA